MDTDAEAQESIMLDLWTLYHERHPIESPFYYPSNPPKLSLFGEYKQALKWFLEDFKEALKND